MSEAFYEYGFTKLGLAPPCMSKVTTSFLQNGLAAPGYTGTSTRPKAVKILLVFDVVFFNEALP